MKIAVKGSALDVFKLHTYEHRALRNPELNKAFLLHGNGRTLLKGDRLLFTWLHHGTFILVSKRLGYA